MTFKRDISSAVNSLISSQLDDWELAGNNYRDLADVMIRSLKMGNGISVKVQFNPARIRSSAAKVDKDSLKERPCFLCTQNLPRKQEWVDFNDRYLILVNPFPIFPRHLTIAMKEHTDQRIKGRFSDMLLLAEALDDYTVFYNGPRCGASAPDHFHFQAGNKGFMPVEEESRFFPRKRIYSDKSSSIAVMEGYLRHTLVLEGRSVESLDRRFTKIYDILQQIQKVEDEPMMNILAAFDENRWRVFIFPRRAHRPVQFYEKGDRQILLSPASVDFGGVWITPRREGFEKLDAAAVKDIFSQVSLGKEDWRGLIKLLGADKKQTTNDI